MNATTGTNTGAGVSYACGTCCCFVSKNMARAHRVAVYASAFLLIYLLVFLAVLPVPFLEPDIVAQLLPVVRNASCL